MPDSTDSKNTPARDADPFRTQGGFADLTGYALTTWEPDLAEVTITLEDKHMNRSGVMHGGMLTTLIDTACGYAGCYAPEGAEPLRAFTLSLTCSFIGAGKLGQRIVARARRSGGGKSIYFADCEVRDEDGRMIATGQGSFKYITLRK